jgi:DNA mismatch repair protein MutL
VVGQPFLFPAMVELGVADARVIADSLPALAELGFALEPFGGTTFALQAVPALLVGADYARVLGDLARELSTVGAHHAFEAAVQDLMATMACHASVRAHEAMTPEESRALLDALDRIDFMSRCPHGRPVAAELTLAELEKRVARR